MKKVIAIVLAVALVAVLIPGIALAGKGGNGNGCPSGPHYNLNIIGMPKDKAADMTGNKGHRIFVKLEGTSRIYLTEGPFEVLDANGTDGRAEFQLPDPVASEDGDNYYTAYSVFIRPLGKLGKSATMTTVLIDEEGKEWWSTENVVLVRDSPAKGNNKFKNVSKELLFVYVDLDEDGTLERYPLFCDELYEFFWNYDNSGLKLAQLRFYEVSTTVPKK
jgi:hypothetical protein